MSVTVLICHCCGDAFPSDEGKQYPTCVGCGPKPQMRTYADPAFIWHSDNRHYLAC
jgi:hypothetical protein